MPSEYQNATARPASLEEETRTVIEEVRMVLPGIQAMDQEEQEGKREGNDRVILMPAWHDRVGEFENTSDLPERLREEIEQLFLSTTFFTTKNPKILGWKVEKSSIQASRMERSQWS